MPILLPSISDARRIKLFYLRRANLTLVADLAHTVRSLNFECQSLEESQRVKSKLHTSLLNAIRT